jgi:hypothetical protein
MLDPEVKEAPKVRNPPTMVLPLSFLSFSNGGFLVQTVVA